MLSSVSMDKLEEKLTDPKHRLLIAGMYKNGTFQGCSAAGYPFTKKILYGFVYNTMSCQVKKFWNFLRVIMYE